MHVVFGMIDLYQTTVIGTNASNGAPRRTCHEDAAECKRSLATLRIASRFHVRTEWVIVSESQFSERSNSVLGRGYYQAQRTGEVDWLTSVCDLRHLRRYVVDWMTAPRKSAQLAEHSLPSPSLDQRIAPGSLTLHADRGISMRSKPVAVRNVKITTRTSNWDYRLPKGQDSDNERPSIFASTPKSSDCSTPTSSSMKG